LATVGNEATARIRHRMRLRPRRPTVAGPQAAPGDGSERPGRARQQADLEHSPSGLLVLLRSVPMV